VKLRTRRPAGKRVLSVTFLSEICIQISDNLSSLCRHERLEATDRECVAWRRVQAAVIR
jgi:hypothetical protein